MRFRDTCVLAFCRLGVAGLAPKAPGTWGTALACLLAPFVFLPLGMGWRVLALRGRGRALGPAVRGGVALGRAGLGPADTMPFCPLTMRGSRCPKDLRMATVIAWKRLCRYACCLHP